MTHKTEAEQFSEHYHTMNRISGEGFEKKKNVKNICLWDLFREFDLKKQHIYITKIKKQSFLGSSHPFCDPETARPTSCYFLLFSHEREGGKRCGLMN